MGTVLSIFSSLRRGADVGAVIMSGTLFGLIVVIFGLVLRFDPEARRVPERDHEPGALS